MERLLQNHNLATGIGRCSRNRFTFAAKSVVWTRTHSSERCSDYAQKPPKEAAPSERLNVICYHIFSEAAKGSGKHSLPHTVQRGLQRMPSRYTFFQYARNLSRTMKKSRKDRETAQTGARTLGLRDLFPSD